MQLRTDFNRVFPAKPLPATVALLLSLGASLAADGAPPTFPSERIGVPPLSLSEAIASGGNGANPLQFGTRLPSHAMNGEAPILSPNLVPRITPDAMQGQRAAAKRSPRIFRSLGMPIIEPNDDVDYKMRIVPPNPAVDFKLLIQDPTPAESSRKE